MRIALALAVMAAPAMAESPDYSRKQGVLMFTQEPCAEVISLIDGPMPELDDHEMLMHGITPHLERLGAYGVELGAAWGFILGFDAAHGGLHSETETTLQRLRSACEETPDRPALEILTSFIP